MRLTRHFAIGLLLRIAGVVLLAGCSNGAAARVSPPLASAATSLSSKEPASVTSALAAETRADKAFAKYGITGKGVIVAILDRGIDYTHPDFRNANGTTRIKSMWDLSGENLCTSGSPVFYSETQINSALSGGTPLAERDAVGHGTVTAGIAAGNGRAFASGKYAGMAPNSDLLIVKVTSEGAPAHGNQAPESPFQGCYNQALDLVANAATQRKEPIVALINSGTQWGPIDGTSAVSREINLDFGSSKSGFAYVSASGDEGTLANHAGGSYSNASPTVFNVTKSSATTSYMQIWYTGAQPANVSVSFTDDGVTVTAPPGGSASSDGISIIQYNPGQQFYPWQSSGPDRAVWIQIANHSTTGTISIQGTQSGTGHVDLYGDAAPIVTFASNELVPGRLTDYSSSADAIVTACYNLQTSWTDIDGIPRSITNEGPTHGLWLFSSGGPTRDGRTPPNGGVDITTPGGNVFAAYGQNSYWETFRFNLIQDGGGWYGRQSATSGASPITVGAIALLLQMDSKLTGSQIRTILHSTARADSFTGTTPNDTWGSGKLDVLAAANAVAAMIPANPQLSTTTLTFGSQKVGTTSAAQPVTLSNTGTAPLKITSIAATGDYHVSSPTCGSSLGPGKSCSIPVTFTPKALGTRNGTLKIKDVNSTSPQSVQLTGTGT